jgi:ABC-type polysaccharide/polyol phosphate export permease
MQNPPTSRLQKALDDLFTGFRSTNVWPMLGWQDIKQRYRRSALGPFWLTISTGALILGMGPLYGRLLQQDISVYFPYLAISFVLWMLISSMINDSCNAFIGAEGYIKEVKLPLTVHVLRVVWKNILMFAHNFIIVALVMLVYTPSLDWDILLVPLGVFFIAVNGVWVGLLFGILCARYRDIPQVVASLVQVAFFLTPVMWRPEMLGRHQWVVELNPLYHFLEIARSPLLAGGTNFRSWLAVLAITVAGYGLMILVFQRFRSRVAYWM